MKQEKSQLKIGIVLSYVNMAVGNLIPIFYTPIMLALLGQSEYGLYKLSGSVTSYLSLISMGLGSAITRYLIKAREEEGKEAEERMLGLFSAVFHVIAAVTILVGAVLVMNLPYWYGASLNEAELARMKVLVLLMVLNMAVNFSLAPFMSVVTSHEKFLFYQCANITTTCVGPLLNLAALYLGFASVGMTAVTLLLTVVIRVVYHFYLRRAMGIRPRYRGMPTHMMREILKFSFWVFVANVVGQLYNATDSLMIGTIPALATAGVAVYSVGSTLNGVAFSLTTGISSLLAPKANKMVFSGVSNRELTDLAIRVGRLQGYIMTLVVSGFIAFGQPFIHFYAGEEYKDAYWVAVFMMVPNMIPLVQSVCLSIITAQNKHAFRSLVYLGIAVLNVVATWFLMQTMGIIGAALTTGAALLIGQGFAMNWYYHRKTGLDMRRFWREVCPVAWVGLLLCTATMILSNWVDFYCILTMLAGIVIYTAVYAALNWRFVMNSYEKDLLRGPIAMVRQRIRR